jgi:16S rRNA (guanine(527)-N(7))-methyltransferase RsmG
VNDNNKTAIWQDFAARNQLTDGQLQQFKLYASMLQEWNEYFNLTALTDTDDIIEHHFQDSIEIAKCIDISKSRMIADVGTGAGFPAIPLKIMYPDKPFVLIEVNQKKVKFLQTVLEALELTGDEFVTDDWRTFLRHVELPIDLFLARASLQPEELLRIFKGQSFYKHAQMIYWASQHWQPSNYEKKYIQNDEEYVVGGKKRRYVIFAENQQN